MFAKILINNFKNIFGDRKLITFEEIYSLAKNIDPDLTQSAIRSRLYYLRKQNLIAPIFNNIYTLNVKNNFSPLISNGVTKINRLLLKNYKNVQICFAETRWLNEFSIHQAFKSYIVCMVENFMKESIFYYLTDKGLTVIFEPNEKDVNFYINEKESIVISNLTSRSPTLKHNGVIISKLEKLLVDVYFDKNVYFGYQGSEIDRIFENAENKYNINFSEMLNYSRRRGKYYKLKEYLKNRFPQYNKYL